MKKKIITISIIVVVLILLAGLYLWYNGNYAGKKKLVLSPLPAMEYEWQKVASDNGIVGDYLWQRSREYLVKECGENDLIPSYYIIPGRLTTQPGQSSEVFNLEDQALLLKMYVKANERIPASTLKKSVEKNIDISAQDNMSKSAWLSACLYYYDAYGTKADYADIQKQVENLFDDKGQLRPEKLSAASYQEGAFTAMEDTSKVDAESVNGSLTAPVGEGSVEMYAFEGVRVSSIDLRLIKDLEASGLLPEGSYERNLALVKDALVSSTIHLYAFAYTQEGDVSYVYAHNATASVDVNESILTMLNLARVEELPEDCYTWVKSNVMNSGRLKDTYFLIAGNVDGKEAVESYPAIMEMAFLRDDIDLFGKVCALEGLRVATYNNSPALSLIYREENGRYVLYARENLAISLMVY